MILLAALGLQLAGCGPSDSRGDELPRSAKIAQKVSEIELLQPADEAALNMTSACRFFKGKHWVRPIALISAKELAFKRDGKFVRIPLDRDVKPNSLNEGQLFYRGGGYRARTIGLVDRSSSSFGLNVQADTESNVLIGRYGDLRCPEDS